MSDYFGNMPMQFWEIRYLFKSAISKNFIIKLSHYHFECDDINIKCDDEINNTQNFDTLNKMSTVNCDNLPKSFLLSYYKTKN